MNLACPIDNKDDSIQKVSAVVTAGQSIGTFSGPSGGVTHSNGKWSTTSGFTTLSGSTTSNLASLLAPPSEPKKGSLGILFYLALFVMGITIWLFGYFSTIIPVLAVAIIIITYIQENRRKAQADFRYTQEKPTWDAAMSKWSRLYYCHKHDIVFDPETGEYCDTTSLREFIYKSGAG